MKMNKYLEAMLEIVRQRILFVESNTIGNCSHFEVSGYTRMLRVEFDEFYNAIRRPQSVIELAQAHHDAYGALSEGEKKTYDNIRRTLADSKDIPQETTVPNA